MRNKLKLNLLCCLLVLICNNVLAQKSDKHTYRLRYDYELVGDHQEVNVVPVQIKRELGWGRGRVDSAKFNYGTYKFQVRSKASNQLLYEYGFSPIFKEYQTIAEAKVRKRSFYNAALFPDFKEDLVIEFFDRKQNNEWNSIYLDSINYDELEIIEEKALAFEVDTIQWNGESDSKIDLVLLAEGYQSFEMEKFAKDSKRMMDALFQAAPFSEYQERFNVLAVKIPSFESGTDQPLKRSYKNTALNSSFNTFGSARYLTTFDLKTIYDALGGITFDHFFVLVNSERYGGGGFYNYLNLTTVDNFQSEFVFIHEFGHGFAGLGDEYYTSSTAYDDRFYFEECEPWEPNLTTLSEFDLKWPHLVNDSIPIPTPRDSIYQNVVGVFEGGGYLDKGVYSPMQDCWMNSRKAGQFCPVCREAIEEVILNQSR